eukprot:scaffold19641_cov112-Phaeocystis_antarctica.AAC.2
MSRSPLGGNRSMDTPYLGPDAQRASSPHRVPAAPIGAGLRKSPTRAGAESRAGLGVERAMSRTRMFARLRNGCAVGTGATLALIGGTAAELIGGTAYGGVVGTGDTLALIGGTAAELIGGTAAESSCNVSPNKGA